MRTYGYRWITALLVGEARSVDAKRVELFWHREGLEVPHKKLKRMRTHFSGRSCVLRRPQYSGNGWSYDFVMDRPRNDKASALLTVIDEHTWSCLAIHGRRKRNSDDVLTAR